MHDKSKAAVLCAIHSAEVKLLLEAAFQDSALLAAHFIDSPDRMFGEMQQLEPIAVLIEDVEGGFNGVELTRDVRRDPESPNNRMPIVLMLNGATQRKAMDAALSGANYMLSSPFTQQKCWERIEQALTDTREFVVTEMYVGPERRVKGSTHSGRERRKLP